MTLGELFEVGVVDAGLVDDASSVVCWEAIAEFPSGQYSRVRV